MRQRSLKNQHRMLGVLLERFDAVDVTGMSAWERARAVHGRSAAGLAEGTKESEMTTRRQRPQSAVDRDKGYPGVPSASSVAIPLFPEEEAA